jgi:hypothetical protein
MGYFESVFTTETVYFLSILLVNIFYIAVFLKIIVSVPSYVQTIQLGIQIFLCTILLIRFHPFQDNYKMTKFDAHLIFGAVIIILTNVIFQELLTNPVLGPYLSEIQSYGKSIMPHNIYNGTN